MGAQINKEQWISLFREVGLNDEMIIKWHKLFELRHPEAHHEFLISLGIPKEEVTQIRSWAADFKPSVSAKEKK